MEARDSSVQQVAHETEVSVVPADSHAHLQAGEGIVYPHYQPLQQAQWSQGVRVQGLAVT